MIKKNKLFVLLSFICYFNVLMWASPQDEVQAEPASPVTVSTEESEDNTSIDETDSEVSTGDASVEEVSVDTEEKEKVKNEGMIEQNKETEGEKKANDEKDEKYKESTEGVINGEKALSISAPMFPSKKEIEAKKIQEETLSMLSALDILKELSDANLIFSSNKVNVANLEGANVASSNESLENDSSNTTEMSAKDESEELIAQAVDENMNSEVYEHSDEESDEGQEDDDFIIDDFGDDEDENEQIQSNVDEERFLTFDEEQEMENGGTSFPAKREDISEKGQLSSVVEEDDDKVNISRYTNIKKGQRIDFSYPGEGWVYLGEENSKKGLSYTKRKMESGKTFFSFKAEEEGNYVLNFSYFDAFSGDFIVDAVSVKILPNKEGTQHDSLQIDYSQKAIKKESAEGRADIAKTDLSVSPSNQDNASQDDTSQNSDNRIPKDVPIDSAKVDLKVQDEGKASDKNIASTEKQTTLPKSEKKSEEKLTEKTDDERNKKTEVATGKKTIQDALSKKEVELPPSSKREAIASPYKEPEVVANIATLSVSNAGKKGVDDERAKEIIAQADVAISSGDADVALQNLENFFAIASKDIDKAYLLQGRAYELNGKRKNIKLALQAYKFLAKTFPDSEYRALANERIRYIEKFFVNIK